MKLELLADNLDAVAKVARWYFDEWASAVPGVTLDQVVAKVSKSVGRETAPMLMLAKKGEEVVGSAEFKIREMDVFPEYEHWLGGVYVEEQERGCGVASLLVREVMARARSAGVKNLYLQTEDLTGGLYRRHGFKALEEVCYKGIRVLVMTASIGG